MNTNIANFVRSWKTRIEQMCFFQAKAATWSIITMYLWVYLNCHGFLSFYAHPHILG